MTNYELNSSEQLPSPKTDEIFSKLEKLSHSRLDDQRTAMPWMVAEGVAAIGWKIPKRSPRTHDHQHPTTDKSIDQLEHLHNNSTEPQPGLSNLLLAYRNSIEQSKTTQSPKLKINPSLTPKSSLDTLFSKKSRVNQVDHRNTNTNRNSNSKSRDSKFSDLSNHLVSQESGEIFDEQRALLDQPCDSKSCHQPKSRLNSASISSFLLDSSKKVQNGQMRVSEDRRTLV